VGASDQGQGSDQPRRVEITEESSLPVFVRDELSLEKLAEEPMAVRSTTAQPPVPRQSVAGTQSGRLESEKVVVAAPMSFAGSAARISSLVRMREQAWEKALLGFVAILLIVVAWAIVLAWYAMWGLWLVPYRLIRRGSRKRKVEALRHRETMAAIQDRRER
jgi:hypothetical protein